MWTAIVTIVTEIWSQRDKVVVNNEKADNVEFFCLAQLKCWSWLKLDTSKTPFSYPERCINPIECLKTMG